MAASRIPFALSLIGLGVIGAGLCLHQRRAALERMLSERLPPTLQSLRPAHAR